MGKSEEILSHSKIGFIIIFQLLSSVVIAQNNAHDFSIGVKPSFERSFNIFHNVDAFRLQSSVDLSVTGSIDRFNFALGFYRNEKEIKNVVAFSNNPIDSLNITGKGGSLLLGYRYFKTHKFYLDALIKSTYINLELNDVERTRYPYLEFGIFNEAGWRFASLPFSQQGKFLDIGFFARFGLTGSKSYSFYQKDRTNFWLNVQGGFFVDFKRVNHSCKKKAADNLIE